jgi:flagellar hook-length control protein FliK
MKQISRKTEAIMRLDHSIPDFTRTQLALQEKSPEITGMERQKNHEVASSKEKSSFRETLDHVTRKEDSPDQKNETAHQEELGNKIEAVERKIDKLVASGKMDAQKEAEPIRELLRQLKKALAALQTQGGEAVIVSNGKETPFADVIAKLLAKVEDLLGKPGAQAELQALVQSVGAKVETLQAKLAPVAAEKVRKVATIEVKSPSSAPAKSELKANKEEAKHEKVTVKDLRTRDPGEDVIVRKAAPKKNGNSDASSALVNGKKQEAHVPKDSELPQHLAAEKTGDSVSGLRDLPQANSLVRVESTGQAAVKHYTSFVSTVNKASMESLMENIAGRAFVTMRDGKSELKMAMTPPELGHMKMKLELEGGMLSGKIVVSTPEAKELLDQNLGELQRQMQQAGLNVGSLDVSLGSSSSGQTEEGAREAWAGGGTGVGGVDPAGTDAGNLAESGWKSWLSGSTVNFVA